MSKKKTNTQQETSNKQRNPWWLNLAKIESWVCFIPAAAMLFILIISFFMVNPGLSIVLSAVILASCTPFAYVAWIIAIINIILLFCTSKREAGVRTRFIGLLFPVSIALIGFSTVLRVRFGTVYALGATVIVSPVVRLIFKKTAKNGPYKQKTLTILSIILTALFSICVAIFVGGELQYYLYTVPAQNAAELQKQAERQQNMNQTIQPMLESGLSETLAQMSYAYCSSGSDVLATVGENALLRCNDGNGTIYELASVDNDTAYFASFGRTGSSMTGKVKFSDNDGELFLGKYEQNSDTWYLTLLLPASSEDDLLSKYGTAITDLINSYNYGAIQAKVFYASQSIPQYTDIATLAFLSENLRLNISSGTHQEWSTGLRIFYFIPLQDSLVMRETTSRPSTVVTEALANQHIDINLTKRGTITTDELPRMFHTTDYNT